MGKRLKYTGLLMTVIMLFLSCVACNNQIQATSAAGNNGGNIATSTKELPASTNTPLLTPTKQPTNTVTPTETQTMTISPTSLGRWLENRWGVMFSFIPPIGWVETDDHTGMFTIWGYPERTADLQFYQEQDSKTANEYGNDIMNQYKNDPKNKYKILSEGEFVTEAGGKSYAFRWAPTHPDEFTNIIVTVYVFSNGNHVVVAQYIRKPDKAEDQDVLVETSMKTFRFEK